MKVPMTITGHILKSQLAEVKKLKLKTIKFVEIGLNNTIEYVVDATEYGRIVDLFKVEPVKLKWYQFIKRIKRHFTEL
jgi:predicted nucleotidyltransferase